MKKDWIEVELEGVCQINMGQSPPSSTYNEEGVGLPFFQGKAEFTEIHPKIVKWCTEPKKTAEKDDILISVRAPVGSTNIADQKCAIGRGLAAIRFPFGNKYLWFYLKFIEKKLDSLGTGTTFKAISGQILRSQKIFLPPLPEQRAIVARIEELFSDLDYAIANLKSAQAKLDIYRQTVLKKAFEGGYSPDIKFDQIQISELCEVVRGGSPRPAGDPKFYDGDIPFLKVADLTRNKGPYLNGFTYTIKEAGLKKTRQVLPFTLLLTNSGATLGVPRICTFETTFNDGIAAFLGLRKEELLFHYYFWTSKTEELRNIDQGAAQPNLNTSLIGSIKIPIASIHEIDQIVQEIESRISVADKLAETIQTNLLKSESLRQSILKKAFQGKLLTEGELEACRKEADWEPAEKLLERIRVISNQKNNYDNTSEYSKGTRVSRKVKNRMGRSTSDK